MNVKAGDLAWIVKSQFPENIRKIVQVVGAGRWIGQWHVVTLSQAWGSTTFSSEVILAPAGTHALIDDVCLRPIRGEDGADQTLQWKSVPAPAAPELSPKPQREFSL